MDKIKIAITGGPSGGKTTLIEALQKDFAGRIAVVPEAASILYRGGFPRKTSGESRKLAQKAIYHTQECLEEIVCMESSNAMIVCDRGSLDAIAYWPDSADNFFTTLQTSRVIESTRYQWVIHLDTAQTAAFDSSNPIRIENASEALELNEKIKAAWEGHPQRVIISHEDNFLEKMTKARYVIQMIMDGQDYSEVMSHLQASIL